MQKGPIMTLSLSTRNLVLVLLSLLLIGAWSSLLSAQQGAAATKTTTAPPLTHQDKIEKIPLRILYVGLPATERQKDFVSFLTQHFQEARFADYNDFKEEQADGSDVVIIDTDGEEWGKGFNIKVSEKYTKATISIGIPGAFWCDRMDLKNGYR